MYICSMKVILLPPDGGKPLLFKSKSSASDYARMQRLKFTREMKKHGKVNTDDGVFILPKEYKP